MSDTVAEVDPVSERGFIADRLNALFEQYPKRPAVPASAYGPGRAAKEYSVLEIAERIKDRGGSTSANAIWLIRKGKVRNPQIFTLLEILGAFGAELSHFQPEPASPAEVLADLADADVIDVVMAELGPELSLAVLQSAAQVLNARKTGEASVSKDRRKTTSV